MGADNKPGQEQQRRPDDDCCLRTPRHKQVHQINEGGQGSDDNDDEVPNAACEGACFNNAVVANCSSSDAPVWRGENEPASSFGL